MCKIFEDIIIDERKRVAIVMLSDGKLSIKAIAKYTGLTVAEVKALAKKKSA